MTAARSPLPAFSWPSPPGRRAVVVAALVAALIAAAGGLRLEAAGDRAGHPSADERAYVRLAADLRSTGSYGGPTTAHPLHWAPGAPVLFALADALTGHAASPGGIDTHAARRAQAVVGALTVGAAFALAALIAGVWAGLAAATAVAFLPPMITATEHLTSEPLGAFAVTAALAAVAWAWNRGRTAGFAVAGAALGVACLVRADVLLAALVLGPVIGVLHARRAGRRAGLAAGGATLAGLLVLVAPWSAWASVNERAFVPITDGARRPSSSAPISLATGRCSASSTRSRGRRCGSIPRSAAGRSSACASRTSSTRSPRATPACTATPRSRPSCTATCASISSAIPRRSRA